MKFLYMKWRHKVMTANKSSHHSFMSINYKQKLSDLKLFIILIIFNLMALPYLYIMLLRSPQTVGTSLIVAFIAYAFIFGLGVLIPLLKFPYLNQRSRVDMVYALPMTRKQLFFSDYFSGLTLYLIPYLIQMFLVQLLPVLFPLPEHDEFHSYYYFRTSTNMYDHEQMFFFTLIALFMMIFLYTLTVFIISCTGSMFEAITASLYCNLIIPVFFWTIDNNIFGSLYSINSVSVLMSIIERTSPLGGVFYLGNNYGRMTFGGVAGFLFPYLIVILLLFFFSMRIQIRRKAEEIGTPFVIRALYYTILTVILFIIGTFLFKSGMEYFNLVIILTILFFLIELITNRGIHRLRRSFLSYAITMSALILFLVVYTKTNGFGIVFRTSSPENLNYVKLENINGNFSHYMEYTQKENMDQVLELQKRLLKKYKVNGTYNNDALYAELNKAVDKTDNGIPTDFMGENQKYIFMEFDVKTGIDYNRYYYAGFDDLMTVASLQLSDEYLDSMLKFYTGSNYITISDIYQTTFLTLDENKKVIINGLLNALIEDMKEISLENYLSPKGSTGIMITLFDSTTFTVNPNYTRTIAFMKENSLWIDTAAVNYQSILASSDSYLVSPEAIQNGTGYFFSTDDFISNLSECPLTELNEDIETLFTQAQYQYVTTEPCYYLVIRRYRYAIPPEYSDVAERVYQEYHGK